MRVTGHYISHPKEIITQQYPENRNTLKMFDRFRGEVVLLHDENNEHKIGDKVTIQECRPISKIKTWMIHESKLEGSK